MRCFIRRCDTFRKTCEVALPKDSSYLFPMGYVNGLVLCSRLDDARVKGFILWNPSIRKSIEIPPSLSSHRVRDIRVELVHLVGEGNDYKIVVIPFDHPSWNRYSPDRNIPSTVLIEVYSLSTGCWRSSSIDMQFVENLGYRDKTITSLNGAVHWLGRNPLNDFRLVAFDVQNNVFHYFSLPDDRDIRSSTSLYVLGESLALLKLEQGHCLIWVMKQYGIAESWVNQFKIDIGHASVLYLMRNGKLFFDIDNRGVKVHDTESGEVEDLSKSYSECIAFMDTFVETLALLP